MVQSDSLLTKKLLAGIGLREVLYDKVFHRRSHNHICGYLVYPQMVSHADTLSDGRWRDSRPGCCYADREKVKEKVVERGPQSVKINPESLNDTSETTR